MVWHTNLVRPVREHQNTMYFSPEWKSSLWWMNAGTQQCQWTDAQVLEMCIFRDKLPDCFLSITGCWGLPEWCCCTCELFSFTAAHHGWWKENWEREEERERETDPLLLLLGLWLVCNLVWSRLNLELNSAELNQIESNQTEVKRIEAN